MCCSKCVYVDDCIDKDTCCDRCEHYEEDECALRSDEFIRMED